MGFEAGEGFVLRTGSAGYSESYLASASGDNSVREASNTVLRHYQKFHSF